MMGCGSQCVNALCEHGQCQVCRALHSAAPLSKVWACQMLCLGCLGVLGAGSRSEMRCALVKANVVMLLHEDGQLQYGEHPLLGGLVRDAMSLVSCWTDAANAFYILSLQTQILLLSLLGNAGAAASGQ